MENHIILERIYSMWNSLGDLFGSAYEMRNFIEDFFPEVLELFDSNEEEE